MSAIVSVILAAGRGTRMRSPAVHKVCVPLRGEPVVAHAVETYGRCGISSHFIVVGHQAEQVMEAVSAASGSHYFCYQPDPRGTGNAARTAARLLEEIGWRSGILVVAGDKIIEDALLRRLTGTFDAAACDLAFVVGDVRDFPSSGRVVHGADGRVAGIVEVFDIARMRILSTLDRITRERPMTPDEVQGIVLSHLPNEKKAALALGALWDIIRGGANLTREMVEQNFAGKDFALPVGAASMPPEALETVRHANLSVYLYRAEALYRSLSRLSADNAQQEEYLTDTVSIIAAAGGRIEVVPVSDPHEAMAFNTPEELLEIEAHLSAAAAVAGAPPRAVRPVSQWLSFFEGRSPALSRRFADVYGASFQHAARKQETVVAVLKRYRERFGDEPVVVARAPARINVMGRHIDHQGGRVNMVAIDRDIFVAAGARTDRSVLLHNLESYRFSDRRFTVDEVLPDDPATGWIEFINGPKVAGRLAAEAGDWSLYVKAAVSRFQTRRPGKPLSGMNLVAAGDIPTAAGLSSSSALLVAAAEALCAVNGLSPTPEEFVETCGEAEWFVGTRGGAGDHAAMKLSRGGSVVQLGFFPLRMIRAVPFPAQTVLIVCNSHHRAHKTEGARDIFNHRVACYHVGRELLKAARRPTLDGAAHLRDIAAAADDSYPELLALLKELPLRMTRREICERLPADKADFYLRNHSHELDAYSIRAVVLYGLAEIARAKECPEMLIRGNVREFGAWMNVSHDGDRVASWSRDGAPVPYIPDCSDAAIDALIERARRRDPAAALVLQTGAYSCSIPQIDRMADIVRGVEGVAGAQISGAGLGGCLMVLAAEEALEDVSRELERRYYEPAGLEPDMFASRAVAGSSILLL